MTGRTTVFLAACVALCPSASADDKWPDIIRDAQVANEALLRVGTASMTLTFRPDINKEEVATVQADVSWNGEQLRSRVRVRDPMGALGGTVSSEPLDKTPWELRLRDHKALYIFNPTTRTLFVHPATERFYPLLELHPLQVWLKCCPPGQGKLARDLIGYTPYKAQTSTFKYAPLDGRTIREVRRDSGRGVSETVYDLGLGGNVVRLGYTVESGVRMSEGDYHWRKVGSASVLDRLHYIHLVPAKSGGSRTEEITLSVSGVELHTLPASEFDKASFLKGLPGDTLIDDRIKGRRYRLHPEVKMREQDLRDLSRLLRTRGFLKK